jgi:hypothetical protein
MHQISKTLFCHKTVHVSGIFCRHHQELSTVHTAVCMFHAGYVTACKQSQVGTQSLVAVGSRGFPQLLDVSV